MTDYGVPKVLGIETGKEVCAVMCRLPSGKTETMHILVSVLQRMTYLEAIGTIIDMVDDRVGGLSEMERFNIIKFLRNYLMSITK